MDSLQLPSQPVVWEMVKYTFHWEDCDSPLVSELTGRVVKFHENYFPVVHLKAILPSIAVTSKIRRSSDDQVPWMVKADTIARYAFSTG